jgi:hypothetical protein
MGKALSYLIQLLIVAGAVWLVSVGVRDARKAWQSSSWPTTTGTVVSATESSGKRGGGTIPHIAYTYSVTKVMYTGTSITPGRVWGSGATDTAMLAFQPGSHPRVYYSPSDPREAVLMPGLHLRNLAYVMFGLIPLTLVTMILSLDLIARVYGISPGPGGSLTFNQNNVPACAIIVIGSFAFLVEVALSFCMGWF